jgi:hypothetical protein
LSNINDWLKDYHARVTSEYNISMERKDKVTDWSIGILFVTLVAYAELLREAVPSLWRISLIVGLLCVIMRLFNNSCLAYGYLKKWRYLLDRIEKHWMDNVPSEKELREDINTYHFQNKITERTVYFIKCQLIAGFLILFLIPFAMLGYELINFRQTEQTLIPIVFLIVYFSYEIYNFSNKKYFTRGKKEDTPKQKPSEEKQPNENHPAEDNVKIDRAFDTFLLIQTVLFATVLQLLVWLGKPENLIEISKVVRALFIPLLVVMALWLLSHLIDRVSAQAVLKTIAWYWSFLSFFLEMAFLIFILFLDVLTPEILLTLIFLSVALVAIFGWMIQRQLRNKYGEHYTNFLTILSAVIAMVSAVAFGIFVVMTTSIK